AGTGVSDEPAAGPQARASVLDRLLPPVRCARAHRGRLCGRGRSQRAARLLLPAVQGSHGTRAPLMCALCPLRTRWEATMRLQDFIRAHRHELDACIRGIVSSHKGRDREPVPFARVPKMTDAERRQWIRQDETLTRWARNEGVRI